MNLNYGYDKDSLTSFAASADPSFDSHNLVIDFDGEVVLDPEVHFPHVALSCYKFSTRIKDKSLRSPMMVAALYDALEVVFESLHEDAIPRINSSDDQMAVAA
jgi:hypothetical protein